MTFLDQIRENIKKHSLISPGDKVLVGVSGGADSVSLLYGLSDLRHESGLNLVVAHYHHALRASADKDQRFVKKLAESLKVPFITERNLLKKPSKGSLEEFLRHCRYDFFIRSARRFSADIVALAHTEDDLAETVIMRILRGTGLAGLRAILPKRTMGGVIFVRPMLTISRNEVEAFLAKRKIRFVSDPTNRSLKFTRNKIRLQLIPYLEKFYARDIKERLASLANTVSSDYEFIESAARQIFAKIVHLQKNKAECSSRAFCSLDQSLRRMLLRLAIAEVRGDVKALSLEHVNEMDSFILNGRVGAKIELPGGLFLLKAKKAFVLSVSQRLHLTLEI